MKACPYTSLLSFPMMKTLNTKGGAWILLLGDETKYIPPISFSEKHIHEKIHFSFAKHR